MFPIRIMEYHDFVINTVGVRAPFGVFPLVVLHNQALLPVGNVGPVCLKGDRKKGVATKN